MFTAQNGTIIKEGSDGEISLEHKKGKLFLSKENCEALREYFPTVSQEDEGDLVTIRLPKEEAAKLKKLLNSDQ